MGKATKLQEFVAHGSAVNCLQLGRKSGTVMVTGGDDKKVNVWAVGKPNAIMSLAGHTSAVECVSFDSNEQTVIAGSAGGTLKLWDLEQAKVARTLTGHRSNCVSVQWHPYGEFFASGSVDTNLKIWDIRRKTCIQTYKGHTRGVRQIIFSPDGRWVVSGGDDGVVKLWDLTMGRLVHEFTQHSAPISALAIHPTEFLMASASVDRTLRLWDLESFEQVCCTPPESGQVRKVLFSEDGSALLSGAEESLKVWGWEPVRCFEQVDIRWGRLADLCIGPGQQLLGGSVRDSMVSVWSIPMQTVKPFDSMAPAVPEAPPLQAGGARVAQSPTSPSRCRVVSGNAALPVAATCAKPMDAYTSPVAQCGTAEVSPLAGRCEHVSGGSSVAGASDSADVAANCARMQIAQCRAQLAARRVSQGRDACSGAGCGSEELLAPTLSEQQAPGGSHSSATPAEQRAPASKHAVSVGTSMSGTLLRAEAAADAAPTTCAPKASATGRHSEALSHAAVRTDADRSEEQLMAELVGQSAQQNACLAERLESLRSLLSFWEAGDVKRMLQYLQRLDDPSVAVDVVKAGVLKGGRLDLECALVLLPTLDNLLGSTYEAHAIAALEAVSQLVLIFGQLIRNTRAIARDMLGVDLSAEARQQRCQACYEQFLAMVPRLRQLALGSGNLKRAAAELLESLDHELGLGA